MPEDPIDEEYPEELEKTELIRVNGEMEDDIVFVSGPEAMKLYEEGYYGLPDTTTGRIRLDAFEVSLLLERGRIQIITPDNQEINAQGFIENYALKNPGFWEQYIVYKDLRSRGYPVKAGPGGTIDFFVYPRGTKTGTQPAKFFIHIVNESTPTTLERLLSADQYALQNKRKLVLAISDRAGDVTYYEVTSFNLQARRTSSPNAST